jgi:hypothetical protein
VRPVHVYEQPVDGIRSTDRPCRHALDWTGSGGSAAHRLPEFLGSVGTAVPVLSARVIMVELACHTCTSRTQALATCSMNTSGSMLVTISNRGTLVTSLLRALHAHFGGAKSYASLGVLRASRQSSGDLGVITWVGERIKCHLDYTLRSLGIMSHMADVPCALRSVTYPRNDPRADSVAVAKGNLGAL